MSLPLLLLSNNAIQEGLKSDRVVRRRSDHLQTSNPASALVSLRLLTFGKITRLEVIDPEAHSAGKKLTSCVLPLSICGSALSLAMELRRKNEENKHQSLSAVER